MILFKLRVY